MGEEEVREETDTRNSGYQEEGKNGTGSLEEKVREQSQDGTCQRATNGAGNKRKAVKYNLL